MQIDRWERIALQDDRTLYRRKSLQLTLEQIDNLKKAEAVEDDVQIHSTPQDRLDLEQFKEEEQEEKKSWFRNGKWGVIALVALIVVKFKSLFLLLLTKGKAIFLFLNLGKIMATASSMFITVFVYALFFGWYFAVGFVLLIFLHEMGHALVIKMKGFKAGAPLFIPLVGAVIMMKDQPTDAETEAEIAFGGPAAGTLASLILYWMAGAYNSELFMALAYVGFLINLFNLAPVSPLDGGRIVTAISTKLWIIGMAVLLYLFFMTFNIILLLVIVLGGFKIYENWQNKDHLPEDYYNVSPSYRLYMSIAYFGLMAFTGYMTMECLQYLPRGSAGG